MAATARGVIGAASAYFAITFVVAFALGALRQTVVAPRFGDVVAVALEVPILLVVSVLVARRVVARFAVPAALAPRAAMGALAFAMLMIAEAGLGLALGLPLADWFASFLTPAGALGLAAQIAFALVPLVVGRSDPAP